MFSYTHQTALSSLAAASQTIATTAHNVANLNTAGFHQQQLVTSELRAPGSPVGHGVQTSIRTDQTAGSQVLDNGEIVERSNVDLPQQLVDLDQASFQFRAALTVAESELQLLDELIDLRRT